MNMHELLASLHDKQIISVIPTFHDFDALSELQFQFTDGTHFVVRGWGCGWEVDYAGVEFTTDPARGWWEG
jgi:hypothetical protein